MKSVLRIMGQKRSSGDTASPQVSEPTPSTGLVASAKVVDPFLASLFASSVSQFFSAS